MSLSYYESIFEKFEGVNVLVIGDIILDQYYHCDVSRISPEAPVPISKVNSSNLIIGGAGNVAYNLKQLGAKVTLAGKIGEDSYGEMLKELLRKDNIDYQLSEIEGSSIVKTRVLSKNSQLLRLDFEDISLFKNQKNEDFEEKIKSIISKFDIVIISDYMKGTISNNIVEIVKNSQAFSSIDSKSTQFSDYSGISFFKPNFSEAVNVAKKHGYDKTISNTNEDVEDMGKFLRDILKTEILITRSEEGVSFIGENCYHDKLKISEVHDVTGAGDTCISIFSLLRYFNIPLDKALYVMNLFAKITISKIGTYAPTIEDFKNQLYVNKQQHIVNKEELSKEISSLKKQGKKVVFTNGCFDLLHSGHLSSFIDAKSLGDVLIVAINSDKSVRDSKGDNRPIIDEESRAFMISNLEVVDYVIIFDEETPIPLLELFKPDVLVKGGDYNRDQVVGKEVVESYGGEVKVTQLDKDSSVSTTNIIEKIKNNLNE